MALTSLEYVRCHMISSIKENLNAQIFSPFVPWIYNDENLYAWVMGIHQSGSIVFSIMRSQISNGEVSIEGFASVFVLDGIFPL